LEKIDLKLGDCLDVMKSLPSQSIDLTVTSPPYDNLRTYNGYSFDFEGIAKELYRVTKDGGVVVWIVGDATVKGSETGTSFKQALYFKDIGFNLHDTMIYQKGSFAPTFPGTKRYQNCFEYMFILSKGNPKTFNGIMRDKSPKSIYERKTKSSFRQKDGSFVYNENIDTSKTQTIELNVWKIDCGYMKSTKDKEAYKHSAIFPEKLAFNHIQTWSNEGDTVLDCFLGSGTTGKIAKQLNRQFIGIEISSEYMEIAKNRIYG
jgi:site-specific DNA-methyltransferase (adenine-specific)